MIGWFIDKAKVRCLLRPGSTWVTTGALLYLLFGLTVGLRAQPTTGEVASSAVLAYGFNEGSEASVHDASGNGHTGTISGATWSPQGKFGPALAFNGLDNWVTVNTTGLLDLTTGMTLEAWVFPLTTAGTQDIIIKEGATVDIYNLYARNWRGVPEVNVSVGGTNRAADGTTLPTNVWTHVAGTYDGTTLRLYLNGVEVASTAVSEPIAPSTGPVRIGGNSIWGEYFQGRIDEVRIYDRALTPAEIQTDMHTPVDGLPAGAPTVAIMTPLDGSAVAGIVDIAANASDDVGVVGVQFLLDGVALGPEIPSAPYALSWDTTTEPAGPYTLGAIARDTDGNTTTAPVVSVTVANNPVPGDFYDEVVVGSGLTFPTALEFLPDGRMLITEFRGRVLVAQPEASAVDTTPVLELPNIFDEDVTVGGERGLVNVVADPDFDNNGYIYLFYTAAAPQRDRVSRFTIIDDTVDAASEFVIWQGVTDSTSTSHHGGGLAFGPDGKLYISTGDNGDPPTAQSLTSHHGKILRVNKDGTIPADNPFFDSNGPNIDAIWARGLRNPYRFSFDTANGSMYIGDVGSNVFEEVNRGVAGANYGWPTCEGVCDVAGMTNPLFTYALSGRDAAITGGFVYRGEQFPASYQGVYFYGDFAQNWIRYLTLDTAGKVTGSHSFLPPDGALDGPYDPVMLKQGPDGSLYYVDFGWGWLDSVNLAAIRRIRYISGDQPPVVVASAAPRSGQTPLSVSFSSTGSFDPESQPLSYVWTFGDGSTSTVPHPMHVYTQSGLYQVQLTVSDGTTTTPSDVLTIAVGNPPQSTITSPAHGLVFRAGDVIPFSGIATDPEDGALPPSAYSWTILFHHDSHVHPTLGPVSGMTGGSLTIPSTGHDFSGNTSYEIILTVTDSSGLQHTSSVFVFPHKIDLIFVTIPPGLALNIDGISHTPPYVKDTLIGFQHTIDAPNQAQGAVDYGFVSWSDGGAQAHNIIAGGVATTYTAIYQPSLPDTTPPVRSNGSPSGVLAAGTTQATLSLTTNENASCRYATVTGVAYDSMITVFTTTGGTEHTTMVSGLSDGESYSYQVRCQDMAGNANSDDFTLSFSVAQPLSARLMAAYGFNEGSGASVYDASGNGHTGTISGATWSPQGKFGPALAFNGLNNWVTVNPSSLLELTTGMTLEAWVFPTTTTGTRDILLKEGATVDIYNLYARNWRGRPESNAFVDGVNRVAEGPVLPANVWTHVAGTYDGTTLRLYLNGVEAASTAVRGPIAPSTGPVRIGGNSIWGEYFQGSIDELRIYDRALTPVEIQTDMHTPID
jgi:glucose/arabinose dehydrogenase/PKD repeat protein